MSQSSGGQTSVRLPCWMFTIPSIASACTVSRATVRLTPYRSTISSDEGNASPTPIRPETISAARSVESCWLRRCGSRSPRCAARRPSADTDPSFVSCRPARCRSSSARRAFAERARGRAQSGVLEHAAADEDLLGARVVVVDRVLHLEDEHRQDLAQALVGERAARLVPRPRRRGRAGRRGRRRG